MKKLTLLFLLIAIFTQARAQDVIHKRNGDSLSAKVLRITGTDIEYRRNDIPDSFTTVIPKAEVKCIIYANGVADTFQEADLFANTASYYSSARMDLRGVEDAKKYYRGYKGAKTATFLTSFYPFPIVGGLITAGFISSTPPKTRNLYYPTPELTHNAVYTNAYKQEAYRIKKKKAWGGFYLGSGIIVGIVALEALVFYTAYH